MDKVKVNNQVVAMRRFVKQAKIHTINKFTKQIKFLENRKGNEEQMSKTKRKHQRLLEEINLLKKMNPDSVSKLALSKPKDWKAVLAQKNVPLEERCFALLANHPPVQEAVEKFHSDNSELIPKIPELVKEWEEKKSRSSQIKKKRKGNQNSATGSNSLPIGNKNNFNKSSETKIKPQSIESLESLPDDSDLKSVQSDTTEQNLAIEEKTKKQGSSGSFDPSSNLSGSNKKELVIEDVENMYASDDSLSDGSDLANPQNGEIKEKLPVESKTKSGQSNSKQSKVCVRNNQTNLTSKVTLKADPGDNNETKTRSNEEEQVQKSQDIVSKLLEISKLKTKVSNYPKKKPSTVFQQSNAETDSDDESSSDAVRKLNGNTSVGKTNISVFSTKPEDKNKIKAVTMLDLNELQDVDEIPIEKSDSGAETETDEDSGKQKKDPFFLLNGEPVSESDEDENKQKEISRKGDLPPFKRKPYSNFREQKDSLFPKRKFEKHSENGRNSNFREQKDSLFPKRRFEKHSENGRNSNFREKSFMRDRKELSFKDNRQNFKRKFDDNSVDRPNKNFKFSPKDKFTNRNGTNKFSKNPKEKSFSQNRDAKRNSYPSKPNFSNSPKKNNADDKPLHPSWEAKRKLKEAANTKFQGKRMVFND